MQQASTDILSLFTYLDWPVEHKVAEWQLNDLPLGRGHISCRAGSGWSLSGRCPTYSTTGTSGWWRFPVSAADIEIEAIGALKEEMMVVVLREREREGD